MVQNNRKAISGDEVVQRDLLSGTVSDIISDTLSGIFYLNSVPGFPDHSAKWPIRGTK